MMRIVLDANVLISGLLNPFGPPGRIVDLLLAGEISLFYDDRIIAEYDEVLRRPKFEFNPEDIEVLLDFLLETGLPVNSPPLSNPDKWAGDPGDLPFAEVALAADAPALVTGNSRHFNLKKVAPGMVKTPAECLESWIKEQT